MAILLRPSRAKSARQRAEILLAHWEQELGRVLPRPVVIEGDLSRPGLGLGGADRNWISRHCHAAIHNAASLTFFGTDRQREPWLSNVEGTRRVLDLCARAGIRHFHYVSTAYVCGLREGRILETELDMGQEMANDYERSKVEAEMLVRRANLGAPATIYRPSIIVGDSRTGYTSTFHGFYAMVKFAHTLAQYMVRGSTSAQLLIDGFGLTGHEGKDYVPVDWVSAVITHLLGRPEHQGRTYHLTAQKPTSVAVWSGAIQEAVERYSPLADPSDSSAGDAEWFETMFRRQAEHYRPYWRDDPQFDRAALVAATADVPCPVVDHEMLVRMARFAIETKFGRRTQRPLASDWNARAHMQPWLTAVPVAESTDSGSIHVGVQVNGPGGGQWKLMARDGRVWAAEDGIDGQCGAVVHLSSDTFRSLAARQVSVEQALRQGRITVAGDDTDASVLESLLECIVTPEAA